MPSYKDTYKSTSNFLKCEDLNKKRITLTISHAELKELKEGEGEKIVLSFEKTEKELVMNKTNCEMLEMLTESDDFNAWIGTTIVLRPDMTKYQGKTVACIRIDSELPPQKNTQKKAAAVSAAVTAEDDDSNIPF